MNTSFCPRFVHGLLTLALLAAPAAAADARADDVTLNLSRLLSLPDLTINPKLIKPIDDSDTAFGIEYKYERTLGAETLGRFKLELNSDGLIALDAKKSPHRTLKHGLRLTAFDLIKRPLATTGVPADVKEKLLEDFFYNWTLLREQWAEASAANKPPLRRGMDALVEEATTFAAPHGKLESDLEGVPPSWFLTPSGGERERIQSLTPIGTEQQPKGLYLSVDVDADAETDQTFSDVQYVGSAHLRGKILTALFDYPFALIRGYKTPRNPLNREGGPYFSVGIGTVDASNNDERTKLTTDDTFNRVEAEVFLFSELFSTGLASGVRIELLWRYYQELDAPAAIAAAGSDRTSYFKGTILFPGDLFIEYADGRLPLDLKESTTIATGWRHTF